MMKLGKGRGMRRKHEAYGRAERPPDSQFPESTKKMGMVPLKGTQALSWPWACPDPPWNSWSSSVKGQVCTK